MDINEKRIRSINDIIEVVKETLITKGDIYGPTYRRVATMLSVQPQYSVLVRILEKCARCHNLLRKDGGLSHLREEFIDIACYAILAAFESEDGCAQKVRVSETIPCQACDGTGSVLSSPTGYEAVMLVCKVCKGTGVINPNSVVQD